MNAVKKHILVGADQSAAGKAAADWAAFRAGNQGLDLHLIRTVPEPWAFREAAQYSSAMARARELIDAETARLTGLNPSLTIDAAVQTGETVQVLQRLSEKAEMVVVGTDRRPDSHGEGFGSVSFQTVVLSRSTVAVVPYANSADRHGVIVGVDGSPDSALALEFGAAEASHSRQDLTAIYACPPDGQASDAEVLRSGPVADHNERHRLRIAVSPIREAYPGLVVHEILETTESPANALIHAAAIASLLVIGLRGSGGLRKPVGSIAWQVLLNIQCPTIVTRAASS